MKLKICPPHLRGVPPGAPPFFYDNCPTCQQKLAAGKVTGQEGHLVVSRGFRAAKMRLARSSV